MIRAHLDAAAAIASLRCPITGFGEVSDGVPRDSFVDWAVERLQSSFRDSADDYDHLEPTALTAGLTDSLAATPYGATPSPVLVHLDAFLGNMLVADGSISGVIDFGPTTVGGPAGLDPATAVAYLAAEITPTATDEDRAVPRHGPTTTA